MTTSLARAARRLLLSAGALLPLAPVASAQPGGERAPHPLVGHWTGAFVRAGATEAIAGAVAAAGDSLWLTITLPDRPLAPSNRVAVRSEGSGRFRFATPHGPALVALDTAVQELVGTVGPDSIGVRLQLRRALPPATHRVTREPVRFGSGRVTLPGVLLRPAGVRRPAVAVLVMGRGACGPIAGVERQGELLASHGIAALVYDRRGADTTVRRCATATIPELAEDVVAAARYLAARGDVDARRIGAVAWSAGGWVSAHASARAGLAFLALLVGPSTSVEAQQLGSTAAYAHRLRLAPQDSADAMRYVAVSVGPGDRATRYAELRRLLERGRSAGWVRQMLEADDIPESEAGTDSLWARRNAYDPAPELRRFRGPVLAVYGAVDDVVPAEENAALLRRIAADAGNARVRALVVPLAGHGLEQPAAMRTVDLGTGTPFAYWKSRRPAPQFLDALVGFLRDHAMTGDAP